MTPYGMEEVPYQQTSGTEELPEQGGQLPTDRDAAVLEACYNLYGDVVATASNSGVVQVWEVHQGGWRLLHTQELQASQPTQLAWAHPQHGQLLAVGTSSGKVQLIQGPVAASSTGQQGQQTQGQQAAWCSTAQLQCGKGAVSALAFAPHQHGLVLAAACSRQQRPGGGSSRTTGAGSSYVQLWEARFKASNSTQWTLVSKIELTAAAGSCQCLCWHGSTPGLPPLLLGGHEAGGSIWAYNSPTMAWQELASFAAPAGVADAAALSVHWAPALGRPYELVAASFGRTVVLYKVQQGSSSGTAAAAGLERPPRQLEQLEVVELQKLSHPAPVWKLEFSRVGTTLACSLDGTPEVWLWMPLLDGGWQAVSKIGAAQQQGGGSRPGVGVDSVMVD